MTLKYVKVIKAIGTAHSDWSLFQPLLSEHAVAYTNCWVPHSLHYSSVLNAVIGSNCPNLLRAFPI